MKVHHPLFQASQCDKGFDRGAGGVLSPGNPIEQGFVLGFAEFLIGLAADPLYEQVGIKAGFARQGQHPPRLYFDCNDRTIVVGECIQGRLLQRQVEEQM